MSRTTLDIEEPILDELKRLQEREGSSLGKLASSLLAEALAARKKPASARPFHWIARPIQPRVSLEDKDAVWAILDERKGRRRK
ncbi:MAG TPA: antitoxin [Thermoanaerobaculia bacterium]|nr:antitoxin [Thermoanaerobaculia bacterium]